MAKKITVSILMMSGIKEFTCQMYGQIGVIKLADGEYNLFHPPSGRFLWAETCEHKLAHLTADALKDIEFDKVAALDENHVERIAARNAAKAIANEVAKAFYDSKANRVK